MANIFDDIPSSLPEELFSELAANHSVKIERIVSDGHTSADSFWYDQSKAEWVMLLQGRAEIEYADGRSVRLKPGDYVTIPAHEKHRVSFTSTDEKTVWLAVHYQD